MLERRQGAALSGPFSLDIEIEHPALRVAWTMAKPALERLTGLATLADAYRRVEDAATPESFIARTFAELGIGWDANELDLKRIPRSGGCIVVANHPFGAVEGMVLAAMLRNTRPDVKILANHLLARIPPLHDALLFVDPFGRTGSAASNVGSLRAAVRYLRAGGMLGIFPAGEVAHFDAKSAKVVEGRWNETLEDLVRLSKVPVLPVHFHGQNGALFQLAGLVDPRLRTALLPRELVNKRGRRIEVRVGSIVPERRLSSFQRRGDLASYLRERTAMLGERDPKRMPAAARPAFWPLRQVNLEPVIEAVDPKDLAREIDALPPDQVLFRDEGRVVCWARAPQIPFTLTEIGRLREITFRGADEGTGKSIDLDAFDKTYLHLFVFDRNDRAIVGAYRLGPTDELLHAGPRGLYTSTLFDMKPELFRSMGPALEMGRSFVCERYQKSASGLFLLWRGIGHFIAQNPRYRVLFGPVSISAAYARASRELIVDFVRLGDHMHSLSRHVRPRHPFSRRRGASIDSGLPVARFLDDIQEVSGLVADIEPDQKGVPVLLKQYLKLGGKMLGFNVDPKFRGVLDGLILVDLAETDPKTLSRYLGADEASVFLSHHRSQASVKKRRVAG
jgi:putative hemolysin